MTLHKIHDSGYKKLFSNRTFFRQLLETFVNEPWVAELDFTQAETLDKSFVADHYKATESDLIYKVKLQGRTVYIYLLLEFQSTVDRFMAVRVAYYALAFYMDYIANFTKIEKLPALFPIVVYNGSERWTAPETLQELVEGESALGDYGVRCRYFKIAEREFDREYLLEICNLVSVLFLAEGHYNFELLVEEFVKLFAREPDKKAVSLLVNWFRQLAVHGRVRPADYAALDHVYRSAQEVRAMLIDTLTKEKQAIRDEGRREGRKEGEVALRSTVEQILQRRFGHVPIPTIARLAECGFTELNDLINPALDTVSLDEFLTYLPPRTK